MFLFEDEAFPITNMRFEPFYYVDAQSPLGTEQIYNAMRFEEEYWFWFDVCVADHDVDEIDLEEEDIFDLIEEEHAL